MKKVYRRKTIKLEPLAAFDEALDCCLNLRALAALLAGQKAELPRETVFHTSFLLSAEAKKLQERLEKLRPASET
jgi:hypothetical protein